MPPCYANLTLVPIVDGRAILSVDVGLSIGTILWPALECLEGICVRWA